MQQTTSWKDKKLSVSHACYCRWTPWAMRLPRMCLCWATLCKRTGLMATKWMNTTWDLLSGKKGQSCCSCCLMGKHSASLCIMLCMDANTDVMDSRYLIQSAVSVDMTIQPLTFTWSQWALMWHGSLDWELHTMILAFFRHLFHREVSMIAVRSVQL